MFRKLFEPATLLMNRLRFNFKFTLIMLLFMMPLVILAISYFTQVNRISVHTNSEREGLAAFKELDLKQLLLIELISKDMTWRSGQSIPPVQTARIQAFNDDLSKIADPRYFDEEQIKLVEAAVLKTTNNFSKITADLGNPQWTAVDRFKHLEAALNQFNNLYSLIANLKGLTNDLQVETVMLSRLLTEKRQIALELVAKSYALSAYAVGEGNVSSGTFDSLSLVNDSLDSNLLRIKNLNSLADGLDEPLKSLVKADIDKLILMINDCLLFVENEFLIADEINLDIAKIDEFYQSKLTNYYQGKQILSNALDKRLVQRLNENRSSMLGISTIVALILMVVVYLFIGMSLSISMTTESLARVAQQLADGDTTVNAKVHTKDELAVVIQAFNQMAKNVNSLVESVQNASQGVASQSDNVRRLANQTGDAVSEQLQDTQAITAATGDLLSAVTTVSQNTMQVIAALEQATQQTEQGRQTLIGARRATNELGDEIKLSVGVINNLSKQSDSINQVLEVIKSIAEQTNLLALNAAIEAARAGEQGRGFAVVADEVRSLAKRTRESTDEIQTTISSLQNGVKDAVEAMTRSDQKANRSIEESAKLDDALNLITQAVEEISQKNSATEEASQQQTNIASEIENRLNSISQISTVTESNVQQSITASQKLADHVTKLEAVVANFKT